MHRVTLLSSLAASALFAGCTAPSVLVEVLPPRTSATCAAPSKTDAALGRGLLDVTASLGIHGTYVADLRLSLKGADARIDGFTVEYALPDGVSGDVTGAADKAAGELVVGDTVLSGSDDDNRVAVVQNVQLIPRDLAVALQEDTDLGITQIEYETIGVTITPVVSGETVVGAASTFPIDVCRSCLVQPLEVCSDEGQFAALPVVCRPGQDTPLFTCVATGVGE